MNKNTAQQRTLKTQQNNTTLLKRNRKNTATACNTQHNNDDSTTQSNTQHHKKTTLTTGSRRRGGIDRGGGSCRHVAHPHQVAWVGAWGRMLGGEECLDVGIGECSSPSFPTSPLGTDAPATGGSAPGAAAGHDAALDPYCKDLFYHSHTLRPHHLLLHLLLPHSRNMAHPCYPPPLNRTSTAWCILQIWSLGYLILRVVNSYVRSSSV